MASMRDIKRRKESVQSTQQITKAMKLVSTVKLQKAKARAEDAKPYFDKMFATVTSILEKTEEKNHRYLKENGSKKSAIILLTGNRGLAGGYNNNICKEVVEQGFDPANTLIYGVGRKGIEYMSRKGFAIAKDASDMIEDPVFSDAAALGKEVLDAYERGEIGKIYLAYTRFKNTVVHIPTILPLLPVAITEEQKEEAGKEVPMNFEPKAEEALDLIIPKYINSLIYGGFMEAVASENGARMQAMDAATSNADDIIASLSLAYNRARQGAITQELTEIISGAEAQG